MLAAEILPHSDDLICRRYDPATSELLPYRQRRVEWKPGVVIKSKKCCNWVKHSIWESVPSFPGKQYYIHFNGGRSLSVYHDLDTNIVRITQYIELDDESYREFLLCEIVNPELVMPGPDTEDNFGAYLAGSDEVDHNLGNTVLIKLEKFGVNSYILVGKDIVQFETEDEIEEFYSPIGNSDVPYPVAIGTKYAYRLWDGMYCTKHLAEKYKFDVETNDYGFNVPYRSSLIKLGNNESHQLHRIEFKILWHSA